MASNNGASKRIPVKWIRDKAKAAYIKQPMCFICGATEALELHHTHSLTNLFEKWVKENGVDIESDEDVIEIRDDFIAQHNQQIYEDVYTLCLKHHQKLHSIYGKAPELHTAKKQGIWINKQRDKINGIITEISMESVGGETKSSPGIYKTGSWLQLRV